MTMTPSQKILGTVAQLVMVQWLIEGAVTQGAIVDPQHSSFFRIEILTSKVN